MSCRVRSNHPSSTADFKEESTDDLARPDAQIEPLRRLLRTLASVGLFTLDGDRVTLEPIGATLSRNASDSLYGAAVMWMETHYVPFSDLLHTLRTGEPAATDYLGKPFFDWVNENPDRSGQFCDAMASITSGLCTGMFDHYQLPDGELIADIGGPAARSTTSDQGLNGQVEIIGGDFFDSVPTADIYVLSYILHDWHDAAAMRVLRSVPPRVGRELEC
ncbi:methyltransferase [Streptomyces cucumeris]|uniref:methyltransferase n=1 Tax=Streptomyces cucumeris TaxID=2962890 RepID=UPI003D734100